MKKHTEVEKIPNRIHKSLLLMVPLAALALVLTAGVAKAGDSWILPIAYTQGGGWTTLSGAGYGGSDAYEGVGMDGARRVYWKMDPNLLSIQGNPMPTGMNQYTISWYQPSSGGADWQPIESQIRGSAGEQYPNDPMIPWAGMWGTSHEYIGTGSGTPGSWQTTGPGPHTPEGADYNAGANGIYMWLNVVPGSMDQSSWLYAKWDYPWSIDHAWSSIIVTIPEPSAIALGLFGGLALLMASRRGKH